MKKSHVALLVILVVLILDQWLKIYIKTHFMYGESVQILGQNWAQLKFVENPGMAFGLSFGGVIGKYALSIFRVFMAGFLIYFISQMIKRKEPMGLIVSFALIIAGAIGNILDSMFYGMIFSESNYHIRNIATMFPEGGGYAPFLQGKVVDMFYFPMINSNYPDWFPVVGGNHFEFFRPIFNLADSSIFVGVVMILLFYRSYFAKPKAKEE